MRSCFINIQILRFNIGCNRTSAIAWLENLGNSPYLICRGYKIKRFDSIVKQSFCALWIRVALIGLIKVEWPVAMLVEVRWDLPTKRERRVEKRRVASHTQRKQSQGKLNSSDSERRSIYPGMSSIWTTGDLVWGSLIKVTITQKLVKLVPFK